MANMIETEAEASYLAGGGSELPEHGWIRCAKGTKRFLNSVFFRQKRQHVCGELETSLSGRCCFIFGVH